MLTSPGRYSEDYLTLAFSNDYQLSCVGDLTSYHAQQLYTISYEIIDLPFGLMLYLWKFCAAFGSAAHCRDPEKHY
jgi:hypothetical protein